MLFLPYFAVSYGQQVKEISKSSKYCHCYILKWQKVLNHGIKQSDAILKIQYSGGTGTSSWLVSKMTSKRQGSNDSVNKCTLPIQNTNIIGYLPQYYFCLLNFVRPFLGCHFFFWLSEWGGEWAINLRSGGPSSLSLWEAKMKIKNSWSQVNRWLTRIASSTLPLELSRECG